MHNCVDTVVLRAILPLLLCLLQHGQGLSESVTTAWPAATCVVDLKGSARNTSSLAYASVECVGNGPVPLIVSADILPLAASFKGAAQVLVRSCASILH